MIELFAAMAAAALGGWTYLEQWRPTMHGRNPWTVEGLLNILRIVPSAVKTVALVDGKVTSAWRSVRVNEKVGGAGSEKERKRKGWSKRGALSRHTRGLAVDIKPRGISARDAADKIYAAAMRGELGNVHKVVKEATIVHVSWQAVGEKPHKPILTSWSPT